MANKKEPEPRKAVIRHFTLDGTEFTGKPIPITEASVRQFRIAFEIAAEARMRKEDEAS